MSFATLDPSRKGTGAVLTNGNLTATITGLYMACGANPQDQSTAAYYAEATITAGGTFCGFGITRSDALTDTYLGAYANQLSLWSDATNDTGGGMTFDARQFDYSGLVTGGGSLKFALISGKFYIGKVGVGWWNPATETFTGDPAAGVGAQITAMASGNYSLGQSCIDSPNTVTVTWNFGASSFIDTPPSGTVGWPGSGGATVNLTGISATAALGTFLPKVKRSLTGNAASAAVGSMAPRIKPALAGVAATAALGVLAPFAAVALSGVSAASGLGSFAPRARGFLTGIVATGAVGNLTPPGSTIVNLTGISATAALGSLTPRARVSMAGIQAAGAVGTLAPRIRAALSGVVATAHAGSFAVSVGARLHGIQANAQVGGFVFPSAYPKLVSITFTNVGLAATTIITNVGLQATTTFEDLD